MGISLYYVIVSFAISGLIIFLYSKLRNKITGDRLSKCPMNGMILSCRGLSEDEIKLSLPIFLNDFGNCLEERIIPILDNKDVRIKYFSFKGIKDDEGNFYTSLDFSTNSTKKGAEFIDNLVQKHKDKDKDKEC